MVACRLSRRVPLGDPHAAMARARDLALAQTFAGRCEAPYEAFVLTAQRHHGRDGWAVYLLPQPEPPRQDLAYTGGQALVLVAGDGRTVEQTRPLSAGCERLTVPPQHAKIIPIKPAQLTGPLPLETHYYLAARYFTPVFVMVVAGRYGWGITPNGDTSRMTGTPKNKRRR